MYKKSKKVNIIDFDDFSNENEFEEYFINFVQKERFPVIIKSINIGSCTERWTWDYLREKCGTKSVKIHVSSCPKMDFIKKNFMYRTLQFDDFVSRIESRGQRDPIVSKDEKYYLRTLGNDPRKDVCDIFKSFPEISGDLRCPRLFDEEKIFSTVFRIASEGLQLWTHYDVMDNILVGVIGTKKIVLFSPEDVDNLYMTGDKSQVLDIENPDLFRYPLFANVIHYECLLDPGDVLFIPALWFHNVTNVTSSVSVNVFWRHLEKSFYDPSDVYGNKDLVPATSAENILDRAVKQLLSMPAEYSRFYARKLISKMKKKCELETSREPFTKDFRGEEQQ